MIRNTTVRHIGHCSPAPHFSLSNPLQSLPYNFFPYKPGISDCISVVWDGCKISILGNRSAGRKDMDFSWRIVPEEWFTSFSLQECQLQEHGYLCSFVRYIQGFLYKFQGYLIRWIGNDSSIRVFGGFQEINATGTITTIYKVSGIHLFA